MASKGGSWKGSSFTPAAGSKSGGSGSGGSGGSSEGIKQALLNGGDSSFQANWKAGQIAKLGNDAIDKQIKTALSQPDASIAMVERGWQGRVMVARDALKSGNFKDLIGIADENSAFRSSSQSGKAMAMILRQAYNKASSADKDALAKAMGGFKSGPLANHAKGIQNTLSQRLRGIERRELAAEKRKYEAKQKAKREAAKNQPKNQSNSKNDPFGDLTDLFNL